MNNKKILKNVVLAALAVTTVFATSVVQARPGPHGGFGRGPAPMHHSHHHHHHGSRGWAIGAGILGAGILASSIVDAVYPRTTYIAPATYVAPATTVVQPVTTVVQPATTIVQPATTVVQPAGQYVTQQQQVWVEGCWVNQVQANGAVVRVWQPGHYETRSTQVWVQ